MAHRGKVKVTNPKKGEQGFLFRDKTGWILGFDQKKDEYHVELDEPLYPDDSDSDFMFHSSELTFLGE
jgi:hypothetical protein